MKPKFISSIDSNEKCILQTKSDNIEIMIVKDTDEIIQELFDSLLNRYQEGLEQFMEGSGLVFDHVDNLHYKSHKIRIRCGGSYIDFPE